MTVDVAPVSCCPLANHVMTAGGLEIADLHVRVMVSPAVACWCPLIVTFSGATETGKQVSLDSDVILRIISTNLGSGSITHR